MHNVYLLGSLPASACTPKSFLIEEGRVIVSGRYQIISKGAVSYELKERGGGVCFVVTVKICRCVTDGIHCTLYTPQSNRDFTLIWRHNLNVSLIFSAWAYTSKNERYRAQSTYFTVRGQSYFSRLPKYWPPIPLSARRVCPQRRGVHTRRAERGMGGQYFGRREKK
jgi:hypothetical protein